MYSQRPFLKRLPRHIAALVLIKIGLDVLTNIATTVCRIKNHGSGYRRMVKWLTHIVVPDKSANIWKCASDDISHGGVYWCGAHNHLPNTNECQIDADSGRVFNWTIATLVTIVAPPTASVSAQILMRTSTMPSSVIESPLSEPTDDSLASTTGSSPTTVTTRAASVTYQSQTVPENKNFTNSMAIGTGLGGPLGLASFGFIGYLLLRNRSRKKAVPHHSPKPSRSSRVRFHRSPPVTQELIGDLNEFELRAPSPVYEM